MLRSALFQLQTALGASERATQALYDVCAKLTPADERLHAMLVEIAAADDDCRAHRTRHPRITPHVDGYNGAADPVACEADWHRCWTRRETAVAAILGYALAMREGRGEAPSCWTCRGPLIWAEGRMRCATCGEE